MKQEEMYYDELVNWPEIGMDGAMGTKLHCFKDTQYT